MIKTKTIKADKKILWGSICRHANEGRAQWLLLPKLFCSLRKLICRQKKRESKQFLDWPGYISLPLSLSPLFSSFFVLCNAGQTYFILVIFELILGSLSPRSMKMSNMTWMELIWAWFGLSLNLNCMKNSNRDWLAFLNNPTKIEPSLSHEQINSLHLFLEPFRQIKICYILLAFKYLNLRLVQKACL